MIWIMILFYAEQLLVSIPHRSRLNLKLIHWDLGAQIEIHRRPPNRIESHNTKMFSLWTRVYIKSVFKSYIGTYTHTHTHIHPHTVFPTCVNESEKSLNSFFLVVSYMKKTRCISSSVWKVGEIAWLTHTHRHQAFHTHIQTKAVETTDQMCYLLIQPNKHKNLNDFARHDATKRARFTRLWKVETHLAADSHEMHTRVVYTHSRPH